MYLINVYIALNYLCGLPTHRTALDSTLPGVDLAQSKPRTSIPTRDMFIELVCDSGVEGRASSKTPLRAFRPSKVDGKGRPSGEGSSGHTGKLSKGR